MKIVRRVIFWSHLITGFGVGVIVLIMSVTGVLLTYQKQMTVWADTRGLDGSPPADGARPLPVETLIERSSSSHATPPTTITWRRAADAPVAIVFGRERTLFVNAYSGEIVGEGSASMRRFFRVVTDWHRWLAGTGEQRAVGRAITGAANLGFLFLVISGFYLWWPRRWSRAAVRNVALFRGGLSAKARDFNWHNVIGFWSLVPLFLIVLSGVMISYPWASALVYRVAGDRPPAPAVSAAPARPPSGVAASRAVGGSWAGEPEAMVLDTTNFEIIGTPLSLGALADIARRKLPEWKTLSLALPPDTASRATFTLDAGTGGQPQKRATLALDRFSGEELKWEPFSAGSPGRRLRSILRFTHTGEVLGIAGQTIAGLVSLGAVLLVWTGSRARSPAVRGVAGAGGAGVARSGGARQRASLLAEILAER